MKASVATDETLGLQRSAKVKAMAANARQMAGDRYEQQMIQQATIAVYRELLGE